MAKGRKSVELKKNTSGATAAGGGGGSSCAPAKSKRQTKKAQKANVKRISSPLIRRPASRGGTRLIPSEVVEALRTQLMEFVEALVKDALAQAAQGNRKTVTAADIVLALRRRGKTLYGL